MSLLLEVDQNLLVGVKCMNVVEDSFALWLGPWSIKKQVKLFSCLQCKFLLVHWHQDRLNKSFFSATSHLCL